MFITIIGANTYALIDALRSYNNVVHLCPTSLQHGGGYWNQLTAITKESKRLTQKITQRKTNLIIIERRSLLCSGLAETLRAKGLNVLAPAIWPTWIMTSRVRMNQFLHIHSISAAEGHVEYGGLLPNNGFKPPFYIKSDWPAQNSVVRVSKVTIANEALRKLLSPSTFPAANYSVLVQEGLQGPRVRAYALSDGVRAVFLGSTPEVDNKTAVELQWRVFQPLVDAFRKTTAPRGMTTAPYRGLIGVKIFLTKDGPKATSTNVVFGEKGAKVAAQYGADLAPMLYAAATGSLEEHHNAA